MGGRPFNIVEKKEFLTLVDNRRPMKVLMRHFSMTKEEIEWHILHIDSYRDAVAAFDEIFRIRNSNLDPQEKKKQIAKVQERLNEK